MIRFGDEDKAIGPTHTKKAVSSMFITRSGTIQVSTTQDGVLTISGPGVKKVFVHSSHRTVLIVRRSG